MPNPDTEFERLVTVAFDAGFIVSTYTAVPLFTLLFAPRVRSSPRFTCQEGHSEQRLEQV